MLLACLAKLGIRILGFSLTILMFLSLIMGVYALSVYVTRLIGVSMGDNNPPLRVPAFFTVFTVSTFTALRLKISF